MSDRITLLGLEVFARHGVFTHEQQTGQVFVVDLHLDLDLTAASGSDALADTVDYSRMADLVHDVVAGERWDLIERVAGRVVEAVLAADGRIEAVEVTIHKPSAPIDRTFQDVSVTLRRSR